jgi:aromatic ring hydroxylase
MGQASEPYHAVQAFRDLRSSGMAVNSVTWCGVISSLTRQRRRGSAFAQLAYNLWKEMQDEGLATGHAAVYAAGVRTAF